MTAFPTQSDSPARRFPAAVLLAAFAVAAFAASGAPRAAAGDGAPTLEIMRFAFNNRLAPNAWVPVSARIVNPTDRAITVRVAFQMDMGPDQVQYLRKVTLPPRSRRRVDSFVRFDYPAAPLRDLFGQAPVSATKVYADGTERTQEVYRAQAVKFMARLLDVADGAGGVGGRELSRQEVYGILVHPDALFTAVCDFGVGQRRGWQYLWNGLPFAVGESPEADLKGLSRYELDRDNAFTRWLLPDPEALGRRPDYTSLSQTADFPDKWAAYEGVDALVLGRLDGERRGQGLSPQQRHSLMAYLRSGGRVVVMPVLSPDAYRHPFWDRLLPVRLGDVRPMTGELAAFARDGDPSVPFDAAEPSHMIEATPGDGETVVERDGLVLLARRRVGAGEVWFFAGTGGALAEWSRSDRVMARLFRPAPTALPGVEAGVSSGAGEFLREVVGVRTPPRGAMFLLLGLYFGLSTAALLVLRKRGRQEAAWPVVIVLALVATVAARILTGAMRGDEGFIQGEIGFSTLAANEPEGTVTSLVGLYSSRTRDQIPITWTNPDTLATLQPDFARFAVESAQGSRLDVEQDHRFVYPRLRLNPGELHLDRAMTLATLGDGLVVDARLGPDGLYGHIENRTGVPLEGALLRGGRVSYAVGDLAPGARVDLAALKPNPNPLGDAGFMNDETRRRRHILAEATRLDFDNAADAARHYEWPLALVAWHTRPSATLVAGENEAPEARARQLLAVAIAPKPDAGVVRIPAGLGGLRVLGHRTANALYGNPPRPDPGHDAPPPGEKVKPKPPPPPRPVLPPEMAGMEGAWPSEPSGPVLPDYSRRFEPTGWMSGVDAPAPFRFRFTVPDALAGFRTRKMTLLADMSVEGLRATWRARRVGQARAQDGWVALDMPARDGREPARLTLEGKALADLLGPEGELPEIELMLRGEMNAAAAERTATAWTIRMVDAELEGVAP